MNEEAQQRRELARRLRDFLFTNCDHADRDRNYDWCPKCVMGFMEVVDTPPTGSAWSITDVITELYRVRDSGAGWPDRETVVDHIRQKFATAQPTDGYAQQIDEAGKVGQYQKF